MRDEAEQADYIVGLLRLLDAEGLEGTFPYSFASRHFRGDLDIASLGIVKVLPRPRGEADTCSDVDFLVVEPEVETRLGSR